jgi:hypothetical protein
MYASHNAAIQMKAQIACLCVAVLLASPLGAMLVGQA